MGEENKVERNEEEEEEEEEAQEIVLKVDIHCEGCARKVARALKSFQGVEGVMMDYKASKVVVIGKNVDPLQVCERVEKKSGRKVELISHLPKPPEESTTKEEEEPREDELPAVITVVLNVQMHCDACAQVLQKQIRKIKGVECVMTDLEKDEVIVKGVNIDPEMLTNEVYKRSGKQVSVVNDITPIEERKDTSTKEEEEKEGEEHNYTNMEYYSPHQIFSDDNPHACSLM